MTKKKINDYCTFCVIRHAHSTDQEKGFFSGHSNPPLTSRGIKQTEEKTQHLNSMQFDAAFSSDLRRARQTGEIILKDTIVKIKTSKLLRERSYGRLDGKKPDDAFLQAYRKYFTFSYEERLHMKIIPGMESDKEIITRFIVFIKKTAPKYANNKILLVSHGSLMKTILAHLGFATHLELPSGSIENLGYFILHSDGKEFLVSKTMGIDKAISQKSPPG